MKPRSRSTLAYLSLALLSPAALLGQRDSLGLGALSIVVLDTVTGEPLRGAMIALESGGYARTDSGGRFLFRRGEPGSVIHVVIRCPLSGRLAGRVFSDQSVDPDTVSDPILTIPIESMGCSEPPEATGSGTWRGHYTSGFESLSFRSCDLLADLSSTAYGGRQYEAWVDFAPDLLFERWPEVPRVDGYARYYVEWGGELTGPGSYGHLGVHTYRLTVDAIIEIRNPNPGDCL